ncbi:CIA30 family protein [Photobacterium sagamiensis]|uniref:CIA30 family protein n=1 Tax=Photobacterium sagamiensis TaxID=2910241 RepID=UPI003D1340CD
MKQYSKVAGLVSIALMASAPVFSETSESTSSAQIAIESATQSYGPVAGGQEPISVPQSVKQATNTKFDYYITRGVGEDGNKLFEGDREFRFASFNVPNLHIQEDPYWGMIDEFETEDALKTIDAIGGQVTRSYVLSVFNEANPARVPVHISFDKESQQIVFNEELFVSLDKTLALANKHGVRLIFPFIDHWSWWGGITDLAAFRGKTEKDFYGDKRLREDYKTIVSYLLNRTNTITGVKYKDDPAIFAWETGNELRGATDEWTAEMAAFIKSIDPTHLVMDGKEVNLSEASMSDPNIDIISNHYYGGNYKTRFLNDWKQLGKRKPFILGETGLSDYKDITSAVNSVIDEGATGVMLWSLRSHDANGGYMDHPEDGTKFHSYHWPGFDENKEYDEQNILDFMWDAAYRIQGLEKPVLPAPNGVPEILQITSTSDIRWRGVTSAQYYVIERSVDQKQWSVVGDDVQFGGTGDENYFTTTVTDWTGTAHENAKTQMLFQDESAKVGETYYYRIKGFNESGSTEYSNIESVVNKGYTNGLFEDKLASLDKLSDKSGESFVIKSGKLSSTDKSSSWVDYDFAGDINSFWLEGYNSHGVALKVLLSKDGESYVDANSYVVGDKSKSTYTGYSLDSGFTHLRVEFPPAEKGKGAKLANVKVGVGEMKLDIPAHLQHAKKMTTVDSFDDYADNSQLNGQGAWSFANTDGSITTTLENDGMKFDYKLGGGDGYAGKVRSFTEPYDWSEAEKMTLKLKGDGSGNIMVIQFAEADGEHWEYYHILDSTEEKLVEIPFSDFKKPHWQGATQTLELKRVEKIALYVNRSINGVNNQSVSDSGVLQIGSIDLN